ncbi:MAG: phosphatase RsbU N-terminal domain-containing protein [Actinomycetales bacterium]
MTPGADLAGLTQDYRIAFLRYLPRHDEGALTAGYAIGREAIAGSVSLLDLVLVHHSVLREVLEQTSAGERSELVDAAGTFFCEVVAAYEMAQRAHLDRD